MTSFQQITKRIFDLTLAFVGLVLLSPVLLIVAVVVRATSPGPALFIQDRVGRHGRMFRCAKFRTMRTGMDHHGSVTAAGDDRITPVGRFLRRWKLDELPQLWHVLTGRMALVGPRPDVPGYADRLEGDARRVLVLRPGITGPAALFFRDEERLLALARNPRRFNDEVLFPEKVRINLDYLAQDSFWRDIGYLIATVAPGAARRLGLERRLGLDDAEVSTRMEQEAMRY
ncbi:MAG: sugar transferase [Kiritimatiellia bacterium]|jgi:lipopolysaccharide/colanic/teichoic acid biosynthesis glycosyltransferase|nr:sugar transferase [Kiritimatiellia bacterium]